MWIWIVILLLRQQDSDASRQLNTIFLFKVGNAFVFLTKRSDDI